MTEPRLNCVEITPHPGADTSILWLHGLGADGHDFEPIVPQLALAGQARIRFIFPHAPMRPVTINAGMTMRAWYDFRSLEFGRGEAEGDIRESVALVHELMARELARGIAPQRLVLAGFSQGGVIALHAALRFDRPLAGVIALSTYLPLRRDLEAGSPAPLPVFCAHGLYDPIIPPEQGRAAADWLAAQGHQVAWHAYPMAHEVCAEEIRDLRSWMEDILDLG